MKKLFLFLAFFLFGVGIVFTKGLQAEEVGPALEMQAEEPDTARFVSAPEPEPAPQPQADSLGETEPTLEAQAEEPGDARFYPEAELEPTPPPELSALEEAREARPEPLQIKAAPPKPKRDEEVLLVADFNGGVRSNLLGGAMGAWSRDEYDDTQGCELDFTERPRLGKSGGYSMQISYDVDSPNQAYNGIWIKLESLDARPFQYLILYFKAPNYPPYGTDRLKLELKNKKGESGTFQIKRIPRGAWREYKIPLKKFKGLKDRGALEELIIIFEDKTASPKEGIVFLEHIYFTKGEIRRPA